MFFLVLIPLIVFVFVFVYVVSRRSFPPNWPLVGMLPETIHILHVGLDRITLLLTQTGGTFHLKFPCFFSNLDMLITSDPENINHILINNFPNYPKGPRFKKIFEFLGDGFFTSDYEFWQLHRKTILSHFTHPKFTPSLEAMLCHKLQTGLLPLLDSFCQLGTEFDLLDVFHKFTLDVICKMILDHDPCTLKHSSPLEKAFTSCLLEALLRKHTLPESVWKLQKWFGFGGERKIMEARGAFDDFFYRHYSLRIEDEVTSDDGFDILESYKKMYLEEKINGGGSSEGLRVFLADCVFNLLFGGRDTISSCLAWLFWLIAQNPSTETKILEEIQTQMHLTEWRFFDTQESHKLVYLHSALCESLRLFPPAPLEHKAASRSDILPSGHRVRKDARVILCFYSVGRMESVWGKDCLEFKPERWITADGGMKHAPSHKFPAFNAGPRTCVGKNMAFYQMKTVAAAILHHYKIQLVEGHPVSPSLSIISVPKNGLRVMLTKRTTNKYFKERN